MEESRTLPAEDVLALLHRRCGLRPADLVFHRRGMFADVWLAGDLVVKCATGPHGPALLAHEAAVLARLPRALPVAVPPVVAASAAPAVLVCARLPGERVGLRIDAWSPAARRRCAAGIGTFMAALHAADIELPPRPPAPGPAASGHQTVRTKLPKRLKRHVARWRREAAQAEPATLPRVPAHCDLNISNLLAAPDGRLLAVLDFDAARMAPRHMDFRKFWVVDAAFRDDVVAAYAAAGGAPPDEELLARAELLMLLKSARAASRGHARERAAFERLAGNRLRLERTARWRRMLRIRRPGRAQARPMAETVAIQTIE